MGGSDPTPHLHLFIVIWRLALTTSKYPTFQKVYKMILLEQFIDITSLLFIMGGGWGVKEIWALGCLMWGCNKKSYRFMSENNDNLLFYRTIPIR